jgi:ABC-type iron transport system FetAB permease component
MDGPADSKTHLTWGNVGIGFAFVAFDALISQTFGLGVGLPLVTAAVRCIVQLALMALVLQKIFEAENPWGVAGLAGAYSIIFGSLLDCKWLTGLLSTTKPSRNY